MTDQQNSRRKVHALYILSFIFNLHIALPAYIGSSFVSIFTGETTVGLVYTIASVLTIALFLLMPQIIKTFGEYRTLICLMVIELAALFGISFLKIPSIIIFAFLASLTVITLISFLLDVLLENYSKDTTTGNTRGVYLTSANIAWVLVPSLGGLILGQTEEYVRIFIIAAAIMIPILLITKKYLHGSREPNTYHMNTRDILQKVFRDKDLSAAFIISFLLQFFYAWMIIYTPIYLHQHLELSWPTIGIIFSFMLLPFVLIQWPIGRLADTRLGEKELLIVGFIIISTSTMAISFIENANVLTWILLLFTTRIGASIIEIMSETYFFKKIGPRDVSIISLFRAMRPVAYVIGPLLASLFLIFFPFKFIFIALGFIMLIGLEQSLTLRDTN